MKICPRCRTLYPDAENTCSVDGYPLIPKTRTSSFSSGPPSSSSTREGAINKGITVGEYEITGVVGEGGMGVIYSAIHPIINKTVAIKVINKRYARNPKAVARFILEARSVNQIGHHNILDIFSIGELDDGRNYLIMELLDGLNLREVLIHHGSLRPGEILPLFEQICDALDSAHRKGFIHRDIKPENIFILRRPPYPFIKIVDFGLAKLRGPTKSETTETGDVIGTPEYMSPEQCKGEDVDAKSDIYALGILLYELITGCRPFAHPSSMEVMNMQMEQEPCPPSIFAYVPPALERVILKALAKRPEDRHQTARQLWHELWEAIPEALPWTKSLERPPKKPSFPSSPMPSISPPISVLEDSGDLHYPMTMILEGAFPVISDIDAEIHVNIEPAGTMQRGLEHADAKAGIEPADAVQLAVTPMSIVQAGAEGLSDEHTVVKPTIIDPLTDHRPGGQQLTPHPAGKRSDEDPTTGVRRFGEISPPPLGAMHESQKDSSADGELRTEINPFMLGDGHESIILILKEIQKSSPDIIGVAVVNIDGFTIASVAPSEIDQELIGSMSSALLGVGERIIMELMSSNMDQIYVKTEQGSVILNNIGPSTILTLLVTNEAKLGMIFYELKDQLTRINDLLESK